MGSKTNKKRLSPKWVILIILLGLADLGYVIRYLMQGQNVAVFNSKGFIASEQQKLMLFTVGVLLIIAIPTLFLLYFTAWKYRESNTKVSHTPNHRPGKLLDASMWLIPTAVVMVLAPVMWSATHRLSPKKVIASDAKLLRIQVISMRWKWLFIYPEQGIATVNFVQVPVDTPVQFELTADEAPMSSFWIPNLGGQLYSMTSHVNRLNLMADTPGDYPGSSAEINGAGFSGMKFTARAGSAQEFASFVSSVKQSTELLDSTKYQEMIKPSKNNPPAYYSAYAENIYDDVIMKYTGPSEGKMQH